MKATTEEHAAALARIADDAKRLELELRRIAASNPCDCGGGLDECGWCHMLTVAGSVAEELATDLDTQARHAITTHNAPIFAEECDGQ